jgi:hypothetical protein
MSDGQVIRVVQFREGSWLVAQCLEVDIAAQAKTESDLLHQLSRLLVGRILASETLGVDPFKTLPPAPKRYWDMYFEATSQPAKVLPFVPVQGGSAHGMPTLEVKAAA